MKKVYKYRGIAGKKRNVMYGFALIFDGLIRVLSLGYFASTITTESASKTVRISLKMFKKRQEEKELKEKQNAKG